MVVMSKRLRADLFVLQQHHCNTPTTPLQHPSKPPYPRYDPAWRRGAHNAPHQQHGTSPVQLPAHSATEQGPPGRKYRLADRRHIGGTLVAHWWHMNSATRAHIMGTCSISHRIEVLMLHYQCKCSFIKLSHVIIQSS